ncbi:hypothetical protein ACX8Z9_04705 [Arthrobacter halodurans]|uniref:Antitoxin Xre/MbcA/ParS-like toxin-binding domain-containing protein n=1 Tax=Arthrobacter halodurans TaxID=516699 RepID=A0ABV4UPX5_9MICC
MSNAPEPPVVSSPMPGNRETVERLRRYLPDAIVASLAGTQDPAQVTRWARGTAPPPEASIERLRFALDTADKMASGMSVTIAASWLVTANAQLGGVLPVRAIREGRLGDVADACSAFLDGYAG